jgi:hypothetical protein
MEYTDAQMCVRHCGVGGRGPRCSVLARLCRTREFGCTCLKKTKHPPCSPVLSAAPTGSATPATGSATPSTRPPDSRSSDTLGRGEQQQRLCNAGARSEPRRCPGHPQLQRTRPSCRSAAQGGGSPWAACSARKRAAEPPSPACARLGHRQRRGALAARVNAGTPDSSRTGRHVPDSPARGRGRRRRCVAHCTALQPEPHG